VENWVSLVVVVVDCQCARNCQEEITISYWLLDEISRSKVHDCDSVLGTAKTCYDDDRDNRTLAANSSHNVEA
jgi:hypothetical protein